MTPLEILMNVLQFVWVAGACSILLIGSWPESQRTKWQRVAHVVIPAVMLWLAIKVQT